MNFNARFNAKERIYEYKIINREGALSLGKNQAWHIKKRLDLNEKRQVQRKLVINIGEKNQEIV